MVAMRIMRNRKVGDDKMARVTVITAMGFLMWGSVAILVLLVSAGGVHSCATCQGVCGQLANIDEWSLQYENYKYTQKTYYYYSCKGEGTAVCTGTTESKIGQEKIYEYKPVGYHKDTTYKQICKCE